jgi:hypothetical protein
MVKYSCMYLIISIREMGMQVVDYKI